MEIPPEKEKVKFIKGDLMYVGTRELISRFDHVGIRIGPKIIGKDIYLGVTPGAAYYPKPFAISLQVPLNLLGLEAGTNDFGGFKLRKKDWDEPSDFARIVRFITYGRKEAPLYFTISSLRPYTLGHGEVIQNYQASIDVDRSLTGAVFEAYNRWGGFQLQLNDVTFENRLVGALGFVKPLGFLESPVFSSLSLGAEYVADFAAPKCIQISENDRRCTPGAGNLAGFHPFTGQSRDDTFVRTDSDLGRPVVEETTVHVIGFSGELKILKTNSSDIKAFTTWHHYISAGEGLSLGFLGRFNIASDDTIHALRVRTEMRSFSQRFQPAYFDTLYEVSKYQTIQSSTPRFQIAPTKYQSVFGDPDNGFVVSEDGREWGYNLEVSWGLFEGSRSKQIAAGFGLQESTRDGDTNFYAHVEMPMLKFLQIFGSFLRLNANDIGDVFAGDLNNVVLLAGARMQLLSFLFVNASYSRMFQIVRGAGREFHLGNTNIVDESGRTSAYFAEDPVFETVDTLFVDLELGWEFRE